jgi:hypothetical protein
MASIGNTTSADLSTKVAAVSMSIEKVVDQPPGASQE